MRHALGLCATRSSGLTSQFGSMGKPYNAGIAAANGVECATLASLGFTSADDGLMGHQGFVGAHLPGGIEAASRSPEYASYLFPDNKYKLHACCHGLHPMIEALLSAKEASGLIFDDISSVALSTNPRWLAVCDIKRPRTGLEVKFSYNWLAGMTLRGDNTGDDRLFADSLAGDDALAGFAERISVTGDDNLTDLQARGEIRLTDGRGIPVWFDLADPFAPEVLAEKLQRKSSTMIGDTSSVIWDLHPRLGQLGARDVAGALLAAGAAGQAVNG
jgi:2-methylcitrate dehydratase PrpD